MLRFAETESELLLKVAIKEILRIQTAALQLARLRQDGFVITR